MSDAAVSLEVLGDLTIGQQGDIVQGLYHNREDKFVLNHDIGRPGRMQLYFTERDEVSGEVVHRLWDFDPIKLNEAVTKMVRVIKKKNKDSFV